VFVGVDMKTDFYRDLYFDRYHRDSPHPTYQRRGSLQLWQFLVALLDEPSNQAFITWTGRGLEFKLIEPEEVCNNISFSFQIIYIYLYCQEMDGLCTTLRYCD
jgi:hypothetical protein